MAHLHDVIDDDPCFKIDAETREITRVSKKELTLIQGDHNSERCTFEIPREVDGHDLTKCDLVRIHFINISAESKDTINPGIYEVDDLQESTDDPNTLMFSWLIPKDATTFVGTVNFIVEFICKTDGGVDESGKVITIIDYSWHTSIYSGGVILPGMDNSEIIIGKYYDVLDQWVALIEHRGEAASTEALMEIDAGRVNALTDINNGRANAMNAIDTATRTAKTEAKNEIDSHADKVKEDLTIHGLEVSFVQETGQSTDKAMSQKAVTDELNELDGKIADNSVAMTSLHNEVMADVTEAMKGFVTRIKLTPDDESVHYTPQLLYTIEKSVGYQVRPTGISPTDCGFGLMVKWDITYNSVYDGSSVGIQTKTFRNNIIYDILEQNNVSEGEYDKYIYDINTLRVTHIELQHEIYDSDTSGNEVRFYIYAEIQLNDETYTGRTLVWDTITIDMTTDERYSSPRLDYSGETVQLVPLITSALDNIKAFGEGLTVYRLNADASEHIDVTVTGNGITSITKTATKGLTDTYTILFDDGTTTTFDVKNGVGVANMSIVDYGDYEDTYRMDFTDGSYRTFKVPNNNTVGIRTSDSGPIVHAADLIPLEHTIKTKVRSKNLIPYPYPYGYGTVNGVEFTPNEDGSITAVGTVNDGTFANVMVCKTFKPEVGKTYYIGNSPNLLLAYKDEVGTTRYLKNQVFTWREGYEFIQIYIQYSPNATVNETTYPMLCESDVAVDFTPYVDVAETTLTRCGKNMLPPPTIEAGKTKSGITLVDNGNGTVTLNGTATNNLAFVLYQGSMRLKGTYTLSGMTGGSGETYYIQPTFSVGTARGLVDGSRVYEDVDCIMTEVKLTIAVGTTLDNLKISLMLEVGDTATEFELYNGEDYSLYSDGTPVDRVTSLSPITNLFTNKPGAIIDATYNVDQTAPKIQIVGGVSSEDTALPKNPSSSSSQIIVATPICKDPNNTEYYGKPFMRITKELSETLDADLLNGGGIVDINGVKYYTKPYYIKRLSENSFTPSKVDDYGNPIFSPVSNPYHGIITSENYAQKLAAGEIPKKSNGEFYTKEELALADHDEPTPQTIPIRAGNGAMVANPAPEWPFAVTVNKQLKEVKEELTEVIDNLGYNPDSKHETLKTTVAGDAGWWRIAIKTHPEDSVNNIFRLSVQGGGRWSEVMFIASQAGGQIPTITILNHQLAQYENMSQAIIEALRIQYKSTNVGSSCTEAYLEVKLRYASTSVFMTSIIKRGVGLADWGPGDWTLVKPERVDDETVLSKALVKSAINDVLTYQILYNNLLNGFVDGVYRSYHVITVGPLVREFDGVYHYECKQVISIYSDYDEDNTYLPVVRLIYKDNSHQVRLRGFRKIDANSNISTEYIDEKDLNVTSIKI